MDNSPVGLIAHDIAPCQAFELLSKKLVSEGLECRPVLLKAGTQSIPKDWEKLLAECQTFVVGMSSSPDLSHFETVVARWALDHNRKIIFYADTFGAFCRQWFGDLRAGTTGVFVLDYPGETERAQALFPNATIIPTGNPLWDDFFDRPVSGELIREQIGLGESGRLFVLIPGGKSKDVNLNLLSVVKTGMETTNLLADIIFSRHPGDKNDISVYEEACCFLNKDNNSLFFSVLSNPEFNTRKLLCATDFVIGDSPTTDIECGCKRIPSFFFVPEWRQSQLSQELGLQNWPPCLDGSSIKISNWLDLHLALADKERIFASTSLHQQECYRGSEGKDPCLKKMVEFIASC